MVNLLIALSLGVQREQLEHRMGLTWPRPFLLRPLFQELVPMRYICFFGISILGRAFLHHFGDCQICRSRSNEVVARSQILYVVG